MGWSELWVDQELLGATVSGDVEVGRGVAPLHLLDEATLGAPLAVGRRVRHGAGQPEAAFALESGGLALGPIAASERESALDSVGTLIVAVGSDVSVADAAARWRA